MWPGLSEGSKQLLTTSLPTDFIQFDFQQPTCLRNMVLKAPNINGTDENRLNFAEVQVFVEDTWKPLFLVEGMTSRTPKTFNLGGVETSSLRLSHGKIDGGFCLGVGMVRFNVWNVPASS